MEKNLVGGERLGSGNKISVNLKNYERSTHDLSFIWRSSMASGTITPFMTEVGLPGDSFDIDLECDVKTLPTIGPLFGSYKVQLDVFLVPMRLYNAKLHMNLLGIGNNMKEIKLPQIELSANGGIQSTLNDNSQINSSCLMSYLNIRGIGLSHDGNGSEVKRKFNAIPLLAYWDIYKNYYANKQEEIGVVVHTNIGSNENRMEEVRLLHGGAGGEQIGINGDLPTVTVNIGINEDITMEILFENENRPDLTQCKIETFDEEVFQYRGIYSVFDKENEDWNATTKTLKLKMKFNSGLRGQNTWVSILYDGEIIPKNESTPTLKQFDLNNIDEMKKRILSDINSNSAFTIDEEENLEPYSFLVEKNNFDYALQYKLEGLGIKTYQSDLFNNWISKDWIDGDNGINAITSIDTSDGSFNLDTLNLSKKVYNMLNRIAISGGSYDDWLDAVYTHDRAKSVETPIYVGGLSKELGFQEVISNAESNEQPLGTLAGRGVMTNKNKGGKINVKVNEPSYIMGLMSITPRVDYSQGNKWDVNLKTLDDLHKPALDQIGFQDLITDQMAWFDTIISEEAPIGSDDRTVFKSAGKQPAWINYMTNTNQIRGNFAEVNDSMFMTLNRRYERNLEGGIGDLTTYVDPSKFNHIFADVRLDAQNFWSQIKVGITARRKMSSKIMPNL